MTGVRLPAVFIGSSVEGLEIARAIQEELEYDADVTVWNQDVFDPARTTLENLEEKIDQFDFAVFVFSRDDDLKRRGQQGRTVRDNVILELGLVIGKLGQNRTFAVTPRADAELLLPSDLRGYEPLTFSGSRSDGNLIAAVGAACNKIRRSIRTAVQTAERRTSGKKAISETGPSLKSLSFDDYKRLWNSAELLMARDGLRDGVTHPIDGATSEHVAAFRTVYAFLNSLSSAVLEGDIDEVDAKRLFAEPVKSVWANAVTFFGPANDTGAYWDEKGLPAIALVAQKWSKS